MEKDINKIKKVVIVGRMNVGKSTLFNRISSDVKSIIFDYPGVTRDIIKDVIVWDNTSFELMDTGGVSLRKKQDNISEAVRQKALEAVKLSDIVIFVCDARAGALQEDLEISSLLYKMDKKIFLVVNKMDSPAAEESRYQFERLGHKDIFYMSADHGKGVAELLEAVVKHINAENNKFAENIKHSKNIGKVKNKPVDSQENGSQEEDFDDFESDLESEPKECKVVLLGKPNVGKSSLLNALLKQDRAIVSDIPGTTREPIRERIKFETGDIQITDTAGVRRKRSVEEDLEKIMVKTSFKALNDANLVLLLVDSSESALSDQELKLAFYAFENYKSLIILFNKQDLVDQEVRERLDFNLEPYDYFIKKLEIMNISCKSTRNVAKVPELIDKVWLRSCQRFANDELTFLFKDALHNKPLMHKTMALVVRSARQIAVAPITILLTVNVPEWFGPSQLAFLENLLRSQYDLKSVPIKFVLRKRN